LVSSLKIQSALSRIALVAFAFLLILGGFFAFRWCFANSLAGQAQVRELAEFAVKLSPSDPQTHYTLANLSEKSFLPDEVNRAVGEYESATALAPHNFLHWLALGKMRERSGNPEAAEAALRRAVELAPNYAQVRWTLGNILLRRGQSEAAFAEFRIAAAANPTIFAAPVADAALQSFGAENLDLITEKTGNKSAVKASLVTFLAADGKFDAALKMWNQFSTDEKTEFKTNGEQLLTALIQAKRYRTALPLYAEKTETEKPIFERFSNAGFESDIATETVNPFAWQITDGAQPQIALDGMQKRDGSRSLVLVFNSPSGQEFRQISQTIAVESNTRYRFDFFVKASGIKSSATMRWEIVDPSDNQTLAVSAAVPAETDWQRISTNFATAPKTEAVTVRLVRVVCGVPPCSLIGKIWFDDFDLNKF
jgi:tetratricopeptide (TPR) repeat protein